ncbi:hypothetical protein G4Y79_11020 [Phototrophicus methaneseepsis]|uniref:GH18 domain-containing protein n=1 Tax=Phototrophicus methaneseepsis TaxID=2710758 RepID=A0A7S8IGK1_9CHLR|nr:hypothetical protein [Phototrophicus methaneseepsis]QPC84871.1 hypothetical protein G4Y79_11020 [Phototrophicus methaneseepsis]
MSKARERIEKRRARQHAVNRRLSTVDQTKPPQTGTITKVGTQITERISALGSVPRNRLLLLIPAVGVVLLVIAALGVLKPEDDSALGNAYWLTRAWTYQPQDEASINDLVNRLKEHRIDQLYIYLSSLKTDGTWAGEPGLRDRYSEVEPNVNAFIEQLDAAYPEADLYGWIEVVATTPSGYRLSDPQLHTTVAEFSGRAMRSLGIDGVLLDVKPVFTDNDDLTVLLRAIRAEIGLDNILAVVAAPDLTPSDAGITVAEQIAPDTMWSTEYKQRIALQADRMIVTAYNSYLTDPVDYINWVTHQVQAYTEALTLIDGGAQVLISIPSYADMTPAHASDIESIAAALDGVNHAIPQMTDSEIAKLQGVAIYSDDPLSNAEWQAYDQRWPRD